MPTARAPPAHGCSLTLAAGSRRKDVRVKKGNTRENPFSGNVAPVLYFQERLNGNTKQAHVPSDHDGTRAGAEAVLAQFVAYKEGVYAGYGALETAGARRRSWSLRGGRRAGFAALILLTRLLRTQWRATRATRTRSRRRCRATRAARGLRGLCALRRPGACTQPRGRLALPALLRCVPSHVSTRVSCPACRCVRVCALQACARCTARGCTAPSPRPGRAMQRRARGAARLRVCARA